MPVMSGFDAAPLLIKILPNAWIILFSGHESWELERLALCEVCDDCHVSRSCARKPLQNEHPFRLRFGSSKPFSA